MAPDDSGSYFKLGPDEVSRETAAQTGRKLRDLVLGLPTRRRQFPERATDASPASAHTSNYMIDPKMLGLAFGLELAVAAVQWYGGWLMAVTYTQGQWGGQQMMMLAPCLYVLAEVTRVPLALAFRTHKSMLLRLTAFGAALLSMAITIKSTSQIGELMYRPRLYEVRTAKIELARADAAAQSLEAQATSAAEALAATKSQMNAAQNSVDDARAKLAQLPPPACSTVIWYDREGRERRDRRCTGDPRTATLTQALGSAEGWLTLLNEKYRSASQTWSDLIEQRPTMKAAIVAAQSQFARAIMQSQVHSFAGMLFAKGPDEVSENEIYTFLLVFIFIPAVVISVIGFVLTCASVHRRPSPYIMVNRNTTKIIATYLEK